MNSLGGGNWARTEVDHNGKEYRIVLSCTANTQQNKSLLTEHTEKMVKFTAIINF